jgi:signal recognition particle receptor subunit alpha
LAAKGGPGGRGSRKARKAAAASAAALNGIPFSSGDESSSQKAKSPQKGKKMRKWGADGFEDDGKDTNLDFSEQQKDDALASTKVEAVDSSSWGIRTADGKFMLKDIGEEMNEILGAANDKNAASQKSTGLVGSGLGAIGGLFRNVVGGKTLTKEDLENPLKGMEDHLMKKNVAREAAIRLCDSIERDLIGVKTNSFTSKSPIPTFSNPLPPPIPN